MWLCRGLGSLQRESDSDSAPRMRPFLSPPAWTRREKLESDHVGVLLGAPSSALGIPLRTAVLLGEGFWGLLKGWVGPEFLRPTQVGKVFRGRGGGRAWGWSTCLCTSFLPVRKLKFRERKRLAQGHTALIFRGLQEEDYNEGDQRLDR